MREAESMQAAPFPVKELRFRGVTYETRFGTRNYQVTVIKPIAETDWSDITAAVEQNTLTMVTCIEEQPTKRLLVQAVQK